MSRFLRPFLTLTIALSLVNLFAQSPAERRDSLETDPTKEHILDTTEVRLDQPSALGEYNEAYYQVNFLNRGLPEPKAPVNLQSPQACMEQFVLACREQAYEQAAYALNLNLLPEKMQLDKAAVLAEKLYYVIDKRVRISWDELPDRPDAQIDHAGTGSSALVGKARRNLRLTSLAADGRDISLSLQRVKKEGEPPVWLISANTVENIEILYETYGPGKLSRWVPQWGKFDILGIPAWKFLAFLLMTIGCFFLYKLTHWLINRLARNSDETWVEDISRKGATPIALAVSVFAFYLVINNFLSISGGFSPYIYSLLLVTVIGAVTWVVIRAIDYFMDRFTANQVGDISDEQNAASRRYLTYISIARKVITFIVLVVGIGTVLSQFDSLQRLGVSLMASAGVATIILGIAAQSTLGNIIAGLQIAITKPARIGDTVLFEGEYGTIENIRFTYLVVNTWDERRVIVPLRYFITHPFENWSLNDPHLIKPIHIFADPTTNVQKVREKFAELLEKEEDYDAEKEPVMEVVSSSKDAIEIRALCSAKDASTAWKLHCKIREELIAYISRLNDGRYLARERVQIAGQNGNGTGLHEN
ncbi:mechanosensitive ion channel family protein [Flavilitoribacter nigricans]|uniref:Mechanosensitive ion channel protein n=1 Tax=Flavilitoribacter nigricans (strain ATCC 23147 / DSM 23189 / NBRC 102662 / NCIMB 1420 / SS-2) TaxID=1122177 RepID=A0A2D0N425_FLAN2|nr:mechanosensitive ion channel family protein [Flavilitoribacter nigricans]PHN03271.1 mechanosensitive ion channel protein [Flavilitoribacter nigricans DSM 23189 = NBRC 102662]